MTKQDYKQMQVALKVQANLTKRFCESLCVKPELQEEFVEMHVEVQTRIIKDEVYYFFNDTRWNLVTMYNQHGVPIYQNHEKQ